MSDDSVTTPFSGDLRTDGTARSVEAIPAGILIAGKYRTQRMLGSGGMGMVVLARHEQLGEAVALKFLRPELMVNSEIVHRFQREARAAARIRSEHVARVHDVGEHEGARYMVMEYLEGESLSARLKRTGPFPTEALVELMLQACEGLAAAHVKGVVHRDLKPANLFVTSTAHGTDCVKVLDFGVSKLMQPEQFDDSATATSVVLGSPGYMAPEQLANAKGVDHRADIWSLGVCMYRLLSAQKAFTGANFAELLMKILHEQPKPISAIRPDVPPHLEAVVARCMRVEPAERYDNVAQLAEDLAKLDPTRWAAHAARIARVLTTATGQFAAQREPHPSVPSASSASAPSLLAASLSTASPGDNADRATRKALYAVVGATAIVLVGGSAAIFMMDGATAAPRVESTLATRANELASSAVASPPSATPSAAPATSGALSSKKKTTSPAPSAKSTSDKPGKPRAKPRGGLFDSPDAW